MTCPPDIRLTGKADSESPDNDGVLVGLALLSVSFQEIGLAHQSAEDGHGVCDEGDGDGGGDERLPVSYWALSLPRAQCHDLGRWEREQIALHNTNHEAERYMVT